MSSPLEGTDGIGDPRPEESFCPGGAPSPGPPQHRSCPGPSLADDTDANSNGSSGNESNGPESRGASQRSSHSSSSGNGKDSALLETTESSKSTNSQSPSPPSSSIAYSLLSASSEQDNPSTSGCSSEQSARARTQKELMMALRELKLRLPPERRGKGRSGTLATLQYALACVKQVQANQEYYQQWSLEEGEPCAMDMSTYTLEELEHITSEYTLRNQDTFSVAVSFLTGRIVYISEQAGILLRCKRDVFRGARFSELLAPQDVGVFYGSTAPSRLPTWGTGASAGSGLKDFTQEKSVFCRIRGGPDRDPGPRYQPFRLTPYVTKIRVPDGALAQPCCLLIAERIHSGYEAPRIPPDKRIFTTRHTPSCLFQDVDERAAPLLGYLPQDLLGAPVLLFLHPEDRPLMLAIHKKILQLAGQPFDHSPIRFCARNGEYVTMDTSWAGFVHPWSRKVAFVLGRHKVRTAPLNEDVFTPPAPSPTLSLDPDVQELSEQIHRLLLQPVHSPGPTGLCGVGPVTSPGPLLSPGSSSDSNGGDAEGPGPPVPVTFQQICKDVHLVKHQGQQLFIESRARPPPQPRLPATGTFKTKTLPYQSPDPELEATPAPVQAPPALVPGEAERKEASSCSYQQINCLDSILRYLESCNIPSTTKRKCASSSSCTASSASDDDKQRTSTVSVGAKKDPSSVLSGEGATPRKEPVVGGTLSPLALANKAESVVSITSQCSFSSTIVHVGDKKPPESDIVMMEDLPGLVPGPAPSPAPSPTVAPDPVPDAYRPVGLTKAVLSLHTQKEEQAFLSRFRDLGRLRGLDGSSTALLAPGERGCHHGPVPVGRRHHCRSKAKRSRHQPTPRAEAPCYVSHPSPVLPSAPWPPPPATTPFPAVVQPYSLPVFSPQGDPQPLPSAPTSMPPEAFPAPLVTPMVALVLPNYLFPTPSTYPYGIPQTPAEGPSTPVSHSPSPSLPPLPPSPPHRPDSPLFNSRCSSPLQLNLLQLEESLRAEGGTVAGGPGSSAGPPLPSEEVAEPEVRLVEVTESSNQDVLSGSSDLLELLLQEDSRSGTGSAASGSSGSGLGSGSGSGSHEGGSTSASITRSSQSSHTSKYFGSIDSSEAEAGVAQARAEPGDQVIKYVLQDPIWLLMANADQRVMMTYQVPSRDMASVLKQDRERLRAMQKQQPRFSEDQRRELGAVHSWVRKGQLPRALDVMACVDCGSSTQDPGHSDDPLFSELDGLGLEPMEEGGGEGEGEDEAQAQAGARVSSSQDLAMEEEEQGGSMSSPDFPATENGTS
ncbi:period circadian protein homolog 1 isoform X1 [Manis javanica]|uniref:period circadian protein homolog 1 isoform X1 n=1 Tax=Manis javanica TaxID=9974 RepID=UPI0008131BA0|nr:period circadian protein homolog 1 isoform X1 [Manis javanica]XP_017535880.1 period circadian protein homolog 1 isoform X1 [Manis javanica]XP_017535881.1 period circadian protein homolog 1 isoform X1 [Manis javanica]XP_017535882.1 period circadian protein homolog 1 isoform X1 [Manis javanica]XP_017535883.1 period circadian protein homolog 1 isoform X1 [Manis javanica]XP_036883015.1 period circadian protein homolog 1 isoform X1 [Manis javanica]